MNINLEYYRVFYYVAKTRSMSRAAEILMISQPAISRSIRKLEEELKCQLFERIARGVKMTAEGEVLYNHVAAAFERLTAGEKKIRRLAEHESGLLTVGSNETNLMLYLMPKINAFRRRYPQIHIRFSGGSEKELLENVMKGILELAVVSAEPGAAWSLQAKEVSVVQDVFIAGCEFGELRGRPLSAGDLIGLPFVGANYGTGERQAAEAWFQRAGLEFEPEFRVQTVSQVLTFVEANMALGILPEKLTAAAVERGSVFQIELAEPLPSRKLFLVYNENILQSAARSEFISFLLGPS